MGIKFSAILIIFLLFCFGSSSFAGEDVIVIARPKKICQLVGDYDRQLQEPTINRTKSRYQLFGTDLGVPFSHNGKIYLLFGDTVGANKGDAIAYTTDFNPEDGLQLDFIRNANGTYKPVDVPGISQGGFEVPMEGVSVNGRMYIYHTTDASKGLDKAKMGRSVVAVSDNNGESFKYLYDFSKEYFINVSVVKVNNGDWPGLPESAGEGLVMFGSGAYRKSTARLAFQPVSQIDSAKSMRYFNGLDNSGYPKWSEKEEDAQVLFQENCVGELSVSYNKFIRKWIMLYNCFTLERKHRGINMRTADYPWGPWSEPQLIFEPWGDGGYCNFMHVSWKFKKCDEVSDPKRENVWAGEYGPYQFEDLAIGDNSTTTIYFTMSTWNPYTVVLMKTTLGRAD